jgi:catechol 2,3-dioxygenase-like lactoylglutathione lyase family enzyme
MDQHPTGIHHIAIMAADIKVHIEFFSQVLGCPLVALFDMHGVPGGLHAFLKLNDHCSFSVVQLPGVGEIPKTLGVTHAGSGALPSAAGTMQHLAFRADTMDELLTMRDRIRSHGVNVIGPLDHGMCQSIYFAGPDQLTLEVAISTQGIQPERWVDPKTMALAGISKEEAARFTTPAPYTGQPGVAQPPFDPAKPHMVYPAGVYQAILAASDEAISKAASYAEPPVPAA